jgi:GTP-binding protein
VTAAPPPSPSSQPRRGASPLDVLDARFVAEARTPGAMPPLGAPEVAFAGRSNVGKSTLLNAVCQRRALARTSRTPGCTRGVTVFAVRLRTGIELRLVDLPGYGFADRSKAERRAWGALIEGYLSTRPTLRGVMILVDARRGPEDEEAELITYLASLGVPYVLVATKIDKLSRSERVVVLRALAQRSGARVVATSGATGDGRDAVVRELLRLAAPPDGSATE